MMTKAYWQKHQQIVRERAQQRAELWRKIRTVFRAQGRALSVQEVCQALPDESQAHIQRALHELSRHKGSDIYHNGLRGQGSRYLIGIKLIDTVEE